MNEKNSARKVEKSGSKNVRDAKEIGKLLENTRTEKGYTLDAASRKTRIHQRTIKNLEEGNPEGMLNPVYMKSFLKKYTEFLGLGTHEMVTDYLERMSQKDDDKKLFLEPKDETEVDIEKYLPLITVAIGGLIIAVILVFGVIKVRHFMAAHPFTASKAAQKQNLPSAALSAAPEKKYQGITLSVVTSDDSWLSIEKDGSSVFKGVLHRGASESWTCQKQIKMRSGKLDALEFTVNGKYYGKIGKGVQDLIIDAKGLRIVTKRAK